MVTAEFGEPGSGYTVQCSGWYPDWIVPTAHKPGEGDSSFQLAQGYWLGVPRIEKQGDKLVITGYDPPSPVSGGPEAPWLDVSYTAAPGAYLEAMKNYMLDGMIGVDFVAQKNPKRGWYHVPMMTGREPYRGLTAERRLQAAEHPTWLSSGSLGSFAIGFYNRIGGYAVGQVFHDKNPAAADPSKAQFLQGTFVFKLLFAEYDTSKINMTTNPLDGAPEWEILDLGNNVIAPHKIKVRLLQVDVAARDDRSPAGWVFGTFVYDKARAAPSPWGKLTAVGLQWGNDPTISSPADGPIVESWINSGNIPAVFGDPLGRDGRLNGPVDNPASSCLSCHATAQVDTDNFRPPGGAPVGSLNGFLGLQQVGSTPRRIAPPSCTTPQQMMWFRNVPGSQPWGVQNQCNVSTAAEPNLHSLDYSLQLTVGLQSALYFRNRNPCAELDDSVFAKQAFASGNEDEARSAKASSRSGVVLDRKQTSAFPERLRGLTPKDVGLEAEQLQPAR